MNPTKRQTEALRIAVAEIAATGDPGKEPWLSCGGHGEVTRDRAIKAESGTLCCPWCKRELQWEDFPNYPDDLNAVREVIMQASREHECFNGCFWQELRHVAGWPDAVYSSDECHDDYMHSIVNATATQRCIALVMTLRPNPAPEILRMEADS